MSERAYTVTEIDALRKAVQNKWLWGRYGGPIMRPCPSGSGNYTSGFGRSYKEQDLTVAVEQMTRTHMLAGHTAEDLIKADGVFDQDPGIGE